MARTSVPPPTATGIEPADVGRLLEASRSALRLLDAMDEHLPHDAPRLGNEGRVRRQLREAIRLASFEMRQCTACDGGTTHAPVRHPQERPRLVACGECGGTGQRKVFTYPKARRRG